MPFHILLPQSKIIVILKKLGAQILTHYKQKLKEIVQKHVVESKPSVGGFVRARFEFGSLALQARLLLVELKQIYSAKQNGHKQNLKPYNGDYCGSVGSMKCARSIEDRPINLFCPLFRASFPKCLSDERERERKLF